MEKGGGGGADVNGEERRGEEGEGRKEMGSSASFTKRREFDYSGGTDAGGLGGRTDGGSTRQLKGTRIVLRNGSCDTLYRLFRRWTRCAVPYV